MIKRGKIQSYSSLVLNQLLLTHLILLLGSSGRGRGRKPASDKLTTIEPNSIQHATPPKEAKSKGLFRGKLSHTSPILDVSPREKIITDYFSALKTGEDSSSNKDVCRIEEIKADKALALQRIFCKSKSKFTSRLFIFAFTAYFMMN